MTLPLDALIEIWSTGPHAISREEAARAAYWTHEAGELETPENPGTGAPQYSAGHCGGIEKTPSGLLVPHDPRRDLGPASTLEYGYITVAPGSGFWRHQAHQR